MCFTWYTTCNLIEMDFGQVAVDAQVSIEFVLRIRRLSLMHKDDQLFGTLLTMVDVWQIGVGNMLKIILERGRGLGINIDEYAHHLETLERVEYSTI